MALLSIIISIRRPNWSSIDISRRTKLLLTTSPTITNSNKKRMHQTIQTGRDPPAIAQLSFPASNRSNVQGAEKRSSKSNTWAKVVGRMQQKVRVIRFADLGRAAGATRHTSHPVMETETSSPFLHLIRYDMRYQDHGISSFNFHDFNVCIICIKLIKR